MTPFEGGLALVRHLRDLTLGRPAMANASCPADWCSHGECHNGTCLCEIQFDGLRCDAPNLPYFVSFSAFFFLVGAVCLAQLVLCVRAEFARMKTPSLLRACRVTTQKALYVLIFAAAVLRGLYFAAPVSRAPPAEHPKLLDEEWTAGLLSAYYAVLLTGSSLIVCFWAEIFHLTDIRWDRPRFLSKSLLGFLAFNIITYSLLAAEIILTTNETDEQKEFFVHVFNGCYAVLLFIVVVFFLIYGVEVYFKVRGGFMGQKVRLGGCGRRADTLPAPAPPPAAAPVSTSATWREEVPAEAPPAPATVRGKFVTNNGQKVNTSQLHQSRFGLISQAIMLMVTVCFLFSDILGEFWRYKVTLASRNVHDLVFRIVELGVVLWFPCVLWNSIRPEQLWILNPKQILRKLELEPAGAAVDRDEERKLQDAQASGVSCSQESLVECWVCYDTEVTEHSGPLIQPCECRGSTSVVHHDCLKKWLMECSETELGQLHCKVCGSAYQLESGGRAWLGRGLTVRHWLQTAVLVTVMCGAAAGCWAVMRFYLDAGIRTAAVGCVIIVYYVCLRFLGLNCLTASQRAQVSAVKIIGRRLSSLSPAGSPLRRQAKPSVAVVADDRRVDVLLTASGTDRLLPAHETPI
ncbi:uncharacterized protein LOC122391267 isoform X1 [Amphibalanus amphitrite]|uniref:uncharacterized protein LOC122391267 isoform X1 n=1 Tax=Amphibalanus amphitrite TaxID=1232801 RepID=UPI001C907869|nr:uncharacterized protein LOC122391267 isoform X1 [Amphibalanus amphitrite]XP_043240959.1 uncharacterized protein LOC122391267 isoform X1 [Amphibalanus amphitrite]XP_043240960.1 uncharacterized protein LOC122391267 isoform X1 [Amphibalanus amphitrite]